MSGPLAAVAATAAVAALGLVAGSRSPGRRRLLRITEAATAAGRAPGETALLRRGLRAWRYAVAGLAAAAAVLGFGGAFGTGLAVVVSAGIVVVLGREPPAPVAPAEEAALVMELVAGCLDAGLPLVDAFAAGRRAAASPVVVTACGDVVRGLARGDRPDQAFAGWRPDPVLSPFGLAAARGAQTGAAVADELRRCAARLRATRRTSVRRRVQRVSVLVAVPLGLCFLPAFVCVAVVPTVVGLFPSLR